MNPLARPTQPPRGKRKPQPKPQPAAPASPESHDLPLTQPKEPPMPQKRLCFGLAVIPQFRVRVLEIAHNLGCAPSHLMACMAFETGGKFAPDIRNGAGSGAVGLIQFMSRTASDLGTTPAHLARMTAVQQLDYVEKYFRPYTGKVATLGDLYMAILWPKAVGKPLDYALFERGDGTKVYFQNKGLDVNADGIITKQECCAKVEQWLERGMREGAAWTY